MFQRQQRTKAELEELCLMALQGHLGIVNVQYVEIGPYFGPESWTWEVVEAGPNIDEQDLNEAGDAIRTLQRNFDLKEEWHPTPPQIHEHRQRR